MACDLILASRDARAAQSEAGLGFIPGWGGSRRLAERIGTARAKFYYYTSKMIDAETAAEIGLFDGVTDKEVLERELSGFADAVIGNNRNAIHQFKKILNGQQRKARDENLTAEASLSVTCLQDPDTKQRLHDFLTKKGTH